MLSFVEKQQQGSRNSPGSYNDRISPPPSDFLMEDTVVSPALDKYSTIRKSQTDLTDDQLIEKEKQGTPRVDIVIYLLTCTPCLSAFENMFEGKDFFMFLKGGGTCII